MDEKEQKQASPSRSFSEMSALEKVKFIGKVVVFLATGGFVFPTIFVD